MQQSQPLTILVIVDPQIPVPPKEYGGAERIAGFVCEGLEKCGHEVRLMAATGSRNFAGGTFVHVPPSIGLVSRAWRKILFQWLSLRMCHNADIIVNFGRLDYLHAVFHTRKPLLCIFQNPVNQCDVDWLLTHTKGPLRCVGVSSSQIEGLNPHRIFDVIHNATNVDRFEFRKTPRQPPYLAFLGRITANKGADTAIAVARRAGIALRIAGTISKERGGPEFFEDAVRPELGEGIEYVGPLNDEQKGILLGGATALLFPIRWKEPCAVTLSESLACGTPIIATRCASTPEIIEDGKTGFLCDSEEEMVAAVKRVDSIDRTACRQAAEERFSVPVMIGGYLRVIEKLLGCDQLNFP